jgi:hypothetical protein
MRSQEALEKYALTQEWMQSESESIPRHLEGLEWWQRQAEVLAKDFAREIDFMFESWGYKESFPPAVRYGLVISLCCMPIILLVVLLFVCDDGYTPPPQNQQPRPKPASPLLSGQKNEKID